jgi:glycosyltransferase involved in cell wall biosynthesis
MAQVILNVSPSLRCAHMKILVVSQYFWPEEFRINDLLISLKNSGHTVTILAGMPNYPVGKFFKGYGLAGPYTETFEGMTVYRVPMVSRGKGKGLRLILNFLTFAIAGCIVGPLRLREKFDIVFAYEPSPITVAIPAILIGKLKRAKVFLWVMDLWPETLSAIGAVKSEVILSLVRVMVRWIYKNCDRILMQSQAFAEPIASLCNDASRLRYFPNSAEDIYKPLVLSDDVPERKEIPAGFIVMFAGNVGVAQDFGTILDAAGKVANYTDIHFVVLGEGRALPWVEAEIEKRDLRRSVHLLGRHPKEAMPRYFSLADAMLVTLRKEPIFALTIPAKVQSYLACARPVIAALDGEGGRIIREAGAGIAVPSEEPAALADAVLRLRALSVEERSAMGNRGLSYFRNHFEPSVLTARLNGWFADSVTTGSKSPEELHLAE